MKIIPFKAEHLAELKLQPAQSYFASPVCDPCYGEMLELANSFTAVDDHGRVMVVAGFEERWEGHATAWALVSCDAGQHMRYIVRAMKGCLDHGAPWRRIEATVDVGFEAGDRMLRMLGFEREGLARAYTPTGGDCWIYARIRND
jgi:hypothetical protein